MVLTFLVCVVPLLSWSDDAGTISAGDEAFLRIDYAAAVTFYEAELREHPEDAELLWRLSRAYVCMGEVSDEARQIKVFKTAEAYARRCLAVDSTKPEGHTWLAGALGYEAWYSGVSEQIRTSQELLREVEYALRLNPNDDIAYSIKGSFYRALGNVGWLKRRLASLFFGSIPEGGFEESEAAFLKAVSISPRTMRHLYELGILYIDMNRQDDARKVLRQASLLPIQTAIDRPRLAKIRELLSTLDSNP